MTSTRVFAAVVVLLGCLTPPAHAQGETTGRIEGTVTDSVRAQRPLPGVRVVAVGTGEQAEKRGEATTDSAGRYRIDALAPGRYVVGFESPLLDSLEIVLPPRAVTVEAGRSAMVSLAMPPAARLRAALCPGGALPAETGVVYGHVVSAETESPMAGVVVALQWRELALWDSSDHKTLRAVSSERAASVTTDDAGWYRACGVPKGGWLMMQLQHAGRIGPVLRTAVDDTLGIAIRHVSFSASAARDTSAVADTAAPPALTGTATLTGIVRGPGGAPIEAAQVSVRGAASAGVTGADGSYALSALPAGTQELEVRRIGYSIAEASVDLRSGETTRRDVLLQRIVSLDSVRVVATRTRYPEFSEHQKMAVSGRFIGPERMQRLRFSRTSDIVRSVGGYLVENRGGRSRVIADRGATARPCVVNVVIDGFSPGRMDPDFFSVDDVNPINIGAMELYRAGEMAPLEYDHGCGAIAIWTKR